MIVEAVAFEVERVVRSLGRYATKRNFDVMYTKIIQAKAMRTLKTETREIESVQRS